jgi:cytochrome c-type biogenesis protein CcmH
MRAALLALVAALLLAGPAFGFSADEPLPDPVQEKRAREISGSLRCLVCQNQSILDSEAPLARDLRVLVRERVSSGDNDDQVRQFIVDRYGDWVLLKPPFKGYTYLLWFGPLILFVLAAIGVAAYYRRSASAPAQTAKSLSAEEQERLERLLGGDGRSGNS